MLDLDDPAVAARHDPDDFLGVVQRFPQQVREAQAISQAVEGLPSTDGITSIAVLGMGGSGISGDVAGAVLERSPLPLSTLKGYELPHWVGRNTLVFAMSYSGDTEETLSTFREAVDSRGARPVVVSTGGELMEIARQGDMTVVEIPSGLQPRAALGYLAIPILVICERLGLGPAVGADIDEAIGMLEKRAEEYGATTVTPMNPAKRLARHLFGRIPIVYGGEGLSSVAAYRWKCQFNECSKVPSWSNSFPELNHNEVVGWAELGDVTKRSAALIVLRHHGEHPRVAKRIDVTLPLISGSVGIVEQFWAEGSSTLARLFDLIYLGDFVATYLALLQGVDPTPVEAIKTLKSRLAEAE